MNNPQTEPCKHFSVAHNIEYFKHAQTVGALSQLWAQAIEQGDVVGAFWAALTHPHCDDALQKTLCRDMHLLRHQAAADARADIAKSNTLLEENAVLARELGKVQKRCTRLLTEKSNEIEQLSAQLMQARSENIRKENTIVLLRADLDALQASIPELESREDLQHKIDQMSAHPIALETQLCDLRQRLVAVKTGTADAGSFDAAEKSLAKPDLPVTLRFHKTVLCVGGHMGHVATYRDLIERVGGRFMHHADGVEDSQNLLDAKLTAADLVICQTGCISHNAYWRVKDFCKRTGKRCVFVENPGTFSVARGLKQFSVGDNGVIAAENASAEPANEIDR